ncbi:FYVE zinc finger-domain-containing protein [Pholiota molesta]|nr:FYVE zinc finger-domain-containing protein [Pholiota molesta]
MSAPSSPPAGAAYIPYQAYKSKRHSRSLTNSTSHLVPNQSPPPVVEEPIDVQITPLRRAEISNDNSARISVVVDPPVSPDQPAPGTYALEVATSSDSISSPKVASSVGKGSKGIMAYLRASQASAKGTLSVPSSSNSTPKKLSTFRRLPAKKVQTLPPSHNRNVSTASLPPRLPDKPLEKGPYDTHSNPATPHTPLAFIAPDPELPRHSEQLPPPTLQLQQTVSQSSQNSVSTINVARPSSTNPPSRLNSPSTTSSSKSAPYRPGFQPKGVYRPLTDEFVARRRSIYEGEGEGGIARVERTKLERRLEKLIALHFPDPSSQRLQRDHDKEDRPGVVPLGRENRRASSFFDFQSLKAMNLHDAGDLWRGVITSSLGDAAKMDIRVLIAAQEQRITPWQDDATVSKCPLCSAAFHPLTNRKHHCRLCGTIICSLPIKHPQRKTLCSILFVVDSNTREIEEVGEGVDYGVRKRKTSTVGGSQSRQEEEDKFLKGVRICRECRPILLRQQYYQQARTVPLFAKMYERFIHLEADIEESLPKFQELLMTLNHQDQPTKEASAARKRLLESFAQYDRLSKEIRALPCPNGLGSSQDRVQAAIMTRANLFLQKNMFPLQSLPTPKSNIKNSKSANDDTNGTGLSSTYVDPDSAIRQEIEKILEGKKL